MGWSSAGAVCCSGGFWIPFTAAMPAAGSGLTHHLLATPPAAILGWFSLFNAVSQLHVVFRDAAA